MIQPKDDLPKDVEGHVKEITGRVEVIRDIAKKNMEEAHERARQQHDKRGTATPTYAAGDLVYLHRDQIKKNECKKMVNRYDGPMLVLHEGPNFTYKLRNMETGKDLKHMVNACRLRPFCDSRDEFYSRNGDQCDPSQNEREESDVVGNIQTTEVYDNTTTDFENEFRVSSSRTQSQLEQQVKDSERQCHKTLPSGLKVSVFVGDIMKAKAEAIVNPANEGMRHGKGIAAYLARKAGSEMIRECRQHTERQGLIRLTECVHTGVGNIPPPAKYIIHAVGPRFNHTPDKAEIERLLTLTYFHALNEAESLAVKSIVFPAMGCGEFRVPSDTSARAAYNAVSLYDSIPKDKPDSKLQHIFFVDKNYATLQHFVNKFESDGQGRVGPISNSVSESNKTLDVEEQLQLGIQPTTTSGSGGWYRVKRVVKDKGSGARRKYLCVWEDNSRSWVAERDMAPKSLKDYLVLKYERNLRRRRKRQCT